MNTYIIAGIFASVGLVALCYLFFIRESYSEDYTAYGWLIGGAGCVGLGGIIAALKWLIDTFF